MELIVIPAQIKDANIVSNSVAENEYPAWSVSATYALGDRVLVTGPDLHQVWESVHAANTGNNPQSEADLDNPVHWALVGATNAYSMFDIYVSSQTTTTDTLTFTIKDLGIVNAIGLINVDANEATIVGYDAADNVIYNQTKNLVSLTSISDYYDYYFTPFFRKTNEVFRDIPPVLNARFVVTITASGAVKLGNFVAGYGYSFAPINYESSIRQKDYSIKQQLPSGEYYFKEGEAVTEGEFIYQIENSKFDLLQRILREVRAKAALYVASTLYESTIIYGVSPDAPSTLSYATHSTIRHRVEGLI